MALSPAWNRPGGRDAQDAIDFGPPRPVDDLITDAARLTLLCQNVHAGLRAMQTAPSREDREKARRQANSALSEVRTRLNLLQRDIEKRW